MQISKILEIKNYRNLTGVNVDFNLSLNFIVGQNNVGKTNLLELLNKLLSIGKFHEEDFYDIKEPIQIIFQIKYTEAELGYFEDNFDIDDMLSITILAKQESVEDRIEFQHKGSEISINPRKIRGLNFIYYSSLRTPNKELDFGRNVGTGKVLNYLIKESLKSQSINENNLLKMDDINLVVSDLNKQIGKINGLSKEKITTYVSSNVERLVNRILEIGDESGRNLSCLGDGLQYSFNIFLYILELLVNLKMTIKEENYEKIMIAMPDDKKYLPLIIGLDEPEIHQHPYRQRALIKSIQKIVNNQNIEFLELIKSLFDIDGFLGQVFVVTHSPNILLNDYKEIVRIHKLDSTIKVTSGVNIDFEPKVHKHLIRSFAYIKEAMFSESIILVEGDTEFGAVPVFIDKLGYDIDEEGIGVIKLDGADSVKRCLELYRAFEIPAKAIIDKDKEESYESESDIFFTDKIDFEAEIYSHYSLDKYMKYLKEVERLRSLMKTFKENIENFDTERFLEVLEKYEFSEDDDVRIMELIKDDQLKFLESNKTAVNGALLVTYLETVPDCFEKIIKSVMGL